MIYALTANTNPGYIGNSAVTTSDGFPIAAGGTFRMDISDASRLYIIGTAGDKFRYLVALPV